MCKPASFIVTKNGILFCDTDRHEDIKKKYKLRDDTVRKDFVPVEMLPPDWDYGAPYEMWKLHTDLPRDEWPEWYSEGEAEVACREKLVEWWETRRVFDVRGLPVKTLTIPEGCEEVYCWDCTSLKSLTIQEGCEYVNCWGCESLKTLTIPEGCKEVNCGDCKRLKSLAIPAGCKSVICWGCTSLKSLTIPEGCEVYR